LKGVTEVDELVNMISSKVGISADQSRQAVNMVLGFLKDKLPAPIASQVEGLLGGQGTGDVANQAKDMLGGLFGKKE
jgi:hypothetical protein